MNLLMISGDRALASGRREAFYSTLEELHKHFDRIDIICPRAKDASYEMSVFGNVFVHPSPWPLSLQWLWIRRKGARLVRERHYGVVTVHEYPFSFNGIGARWLHRATGVPYLLEVHHIVGYPRSAGLRETIGRWLTRMVVPFTARHAAAVRAVNVHQVPQWLQDIGISANKIVIIPSFYIDLQVFSPHNRDKQYDLIFVGRLVRNKGVELFLEVIRRTGLNALVVGDGPLFKKLKAKSYNPKIPVKFHGHAKDSAEVSELINRSRLLVMTSLNEGGPRVVLESLACGVPVVATPVGIVPDVLPPECIEEWNAEDLAAKVQNLLTDHQLYDRVREAGLFTVQQFERSVAIKAYADALKRLADD